MDNDRQSAGLSRRERQIMDILFQHGEASVAEVLEAMSDAPSYSAVRATLRILEEKGHATHREDGPRYVYLPAVQPERAREDALRHVVATFFSGSTEQAAAALLRMSDTELDDAAIARLRQRIQSAQEEGR